MLSFTVIAIIISRNRCNKEKEKQDVSQRKEGQALPKAQSPVTAAAQGPELQAEGARYQGRVGEQ